ncbi:MAG: outer membrane lipoprotein-sorting protein [Desulfobacteraceae bacterium]|nr:outer membrane lipoprotein-sorting protein [Desulfobacteraceae bacterium]
MNILKNILILIFILCMIPGSLFCEELSPEKIAYNSFHRDRGSNSISSSQMVLIDENGKKRSRNFTLKRFVENKLEHQLIRFLTPADIEGTGFLAIEKEGYETDQFLYLPALRRTRRIVSSQKDQRFVNSDFTYEDMERHPLDDYTYKIQGDAKVNNVDCYILVSHPKEGTKSQYGKTISLIHKESFTPVLIKFFDKKDLHVKTYKVLKFNKVQGIWTELTVSMEDIIKNHKTYINTEKILYNTDLNKDEISQKMLEYY